MARLHHVLTLGQLRSCVTHSEGHSAPNGLSVYSVGKNLGTVAIATRKGIARNRFGMNCTACRYLTQVKTKSLNIMPRLAQFDSLGRAHIKLVSPPFR
jgi:hypothetical protein